MKELTIYKYAIVSEENGIIDRGRGRRALYKTLKNAEKNLCDWEKRQGYRIVKLYCEEL